MNITRYHARQYVHGRSLLCIDSEKIKETKIEPCDTATVMNGLAIIILWAGTKNMESN